MIICFPRVTFRVIAVNWIGKMPYFLCKYALNREYCFVSSSQLTIVIKLFQSFLNNIFEGESFPSAASPLCSISAAPSGTSSRLRSLIIYNSQIFTRYCRYSRYSLDILSSRLRSLTIYNSQIFTRYCRYSRYSLDTLSSRSRSLTI